MMFDGKREVPVSREVVWQALHDPEVLRRLVTGCESMTPVGENTFAATLAARVGPMSDTYRGTFTIDDVRDGEELRVVVRAKGRCGRLELVLRVQLDGERTTTLTYVADATVGGLVSRLSGPAMRVFGNHFTGCFFRGLDNVARRRTTVLAPA